MKIIFNVLVFFVVFLIVMWAFKVGIDRQFVADCYKWQNYESEYPLFELEASTVEMCSERGIVIK